MTPPQQLDPNAYTLRACEGDYMNRPCDSLGILPFERSPGYFVMLCRLCHHHESVNAQRAYAIALRRATDEMYERPYGPSEEGAA